MVGKWRCIAEESTHGGSTLTNDIYSYFSSCLQYLTIQIKLGVKMYRDCKKLGRGLWYKCWLALFPQNQATLQSKHWKVHLFKYIWAQLLDKENIDTFLYLNSVAQYGVGWRESKPPSKKWVLPPLILLFPLSKKNALFWLLRNHFRIPAIITQF